MYSYRFFLFSCVAFLFAQSLPAATFTVTSTGDSGAGTLRQAILNANTNANLDTIQFAIGGSAGVKTITPATALPIITSPVIITGTNQSGYTWATPMIEINGTSAGSYGLQLFTSNSTIKGLVINRFFFSGIHIATNGGNNHIEANFIGTDPTGTIARGNGIGGVTDGITIFSPNNFIGGTTGTAGNVISANGRYGIGLISSGNRVEGNFIGTDRSGTNSLIWLNQCQAGSSIRLPFFLHKLLFPTCAMD